MANYYANLATGNNGNAGTSWALAKATIQAALDLASSGDTVFVAKSFEQDCGPIIVENGSKRLQLKSPTCIAVHDEFGDWKSVPSISWVGGTAYSALSPLTNTGPTIPATPSYIVVRNNGTLTSITINGGSPISTRGRLFLASGETTTATVDEKDFLWFDIGTTYAGQELSTILFSGNTNTVEAVWIVTNLPSNFAINVASLTANGGVRQTGTYNQVLGPNDGSAPLLQLSNWAITNAGGNVRGSQYLTGVATTAWAHSSGTYTRSRWGTTFSQTASLTIKVPAGVKLIGGVNTSTGIEDGVTRLAGAYAYTTDTSVRPDVPGLYDLTWRCVSSSIIRGFGSYNWRSGSLIDLGNNATGNAYTSVSRATTTNVTLSGTGTLIDSSSVSVGNRVLVKNQTTASENGIYVVASGAWTRATDLDADSEAVVGNYVYVNSGSTNGGKTFYINSKTGTFGAGGNITFAQTQPWQDVLIQMDEVTSCGSANGGSGGGITVSYRQTVCPVRTFIRYRVHGPNRNNSNTNWGSSNNGIKPEWALWLRQNCTGWGDASTGNGAYYISETPKWTSSNANAMSLQLLGGLVSLSMTVQQALGYVQNIGYVLSNSFSTSGTGSTSLTTFDRNRGNSFASLSSSTSATALDRSRFAAFTLSTSSVINKVVNVLRGSVFSSSDTSSFEASHSTDKGMPFDVTSVSDSTWAFGPIKQFPWVSNAFSAVSAALGRDRGYSFTSTNDLAVSKTLNVARPISVSSSSTSSVVLDSLKHISNFAMNAVVVNSVVALQTLKFNKGVQFVSSVVSSITHSPAINRVVSAVSSTTTGVVSAIGRTRPAQMVVSAVGATAINFTRVKDMAWSAAGTLGVAVPLRKAGRVAFLSTNAVISYFANNTVVSFISSMTTGVSTAFGRTRPLSTSLDSLTSSVFGTRVARTQEFSSSNTSTSSLSLLRNRGYSFTIPMTPTMTANLSRLVGEDFVTNSSPVISVVFGKEQQPSFTVISQSGNQMLVQVNRAYELVIGEEVTVDGTIRVRRPLSQAFGSSSGTSTEAGVRRGVQFTQSSAVVMSNTASRLVPLAFTLEAGQTVGVSANGNRLDEYFVQFEDDKPFTLADGSIVLGSRRLHSTGIRQNQHPVFNISMPKPDVFDVTVVEDDK